MPENFNPALLGSAIGAAALGLLTAREDQSFNPGGALGGALAGYLLGNMIAANPRLLVDLGLAEDPTKKITQKLTGATILSGMAGAATRAGQHYIAKKEAEKLKNLQSLMKNPTPRENELLAMRRRRLLSGPGWTAPIIAAIATFLSAGGGSAAYDVWRYSNL